MCKGGELCPSVQGRFKKNIAVNVDIDIDDIDIVDIDIDDIKESENLSVQAEKSLRSLVRRVDGCEGYLHVPWE